MSSRFNQPALERSAQLRATHVAQPPRPAGRASAVAPQTEVDWQLRKSRAVRALDTIRLCYEALQATPIASTDDAEREICRRVIDMHRAAKRQHHKAARRAAVRAGAAVLALLLDLIPANVAQSPPAVDPSIPEASP